MYDDLDVYRIVSDETADELVEKLYAEYNQQEVGDIFRKSLNDLNTFDYNNLPDHMRHYFKSNQEFPGWMDENKVKLAQDLFLKIGPEYSACLLTRALPVAYTTYNSVKVLAATDYLSSNIRVGTAKRLLETTQFLFNVMAVDSLNNKNSLGINHTLRVRFIHAMVRHHLLKHSWDIDTHGIPVNQEDMAGAILTFSIGALKGLDKLNIVLSDNEKEAIVHIWAVIGHYMGVDETLNPSTHQEAEALYERILEHQAQPSEEGQSLNRALCDFVNGFLNIKQLPDIADYLLKYLINDKKYSDMLGLETKRMSYQAIAFQVAMNYIKILNKYRNYSVVSRLVTPLNKLLAHRLLKYFDEEFDMRLSIPPSIQSAWGLRTQA